MFSNKALKQLLIPLVIEQVLVMLVGMADTLMVSSVGEAAVSGVALVDMVNNLLITVLAAVATGGAVIVSQYLGAHKRQEAEQSSGQLMMVTVMISTVIMGFCLATSRPLLSLLFGTVEPAVMDAALTYFIVTAFSLPALGMYNSAAATFRSMNKTNITMYVSLLMNAINIIGDIIGVMVLRAGVMGVAIPTLISRIVAGLVMAHLAFGKKHEISLHWKNILTWKADTVTRIMRIAVPSGIENGLFSLGRLLVTSIVALFGTTQIAANGVAGSLQQISCMMVSAVNLAVITVVGQCIGAGEPAQAKRYTWKLMKISYAFSGVVGAAVCFALPLLLPLYNLSPQTLRIAAILVVAHNIMAFALHPTSFNLPNALRAAGDVNFTMVVGICSMILFRVGSAYLFGIVFKMGVYGVCIAMGTDWLARSIAFSLRYKSGKWLTFQSI